MILLQTHMTYEKQFRNFQIQEARLDRKRSKAMAELERLQSDRNSAESTEPADRAATANEQSMSDEEFFAALDAGFIPPSLAAHLSSTKPVTENGFVFLNSDFEALSGSSQTLPFSQSQLPRE
jgi:hypothetical protein